MQYVRPEIETTCLGQAASSAAVLLAAGAPGKRAALTNARIVIHQPSTEATHGASSDLEIQAREIMRARAQIEEILALHTGRPREQVAADVERDRYMTAAQASDYGLIDEILTTRKPPGFPS